MLKALLASAKLGAESLLRARRSTMRSYIWPSIQGRTNLMPKGRLIAFSNPCSSDREQEFNEWYDGVHADEILALPGIAAMRRYRIVPQPDRAAELPHRYAAIFELDDIETAMASLSQATATFTMTDTIDLHGSVLAVYEEISSR
jgi:hypothetical protein